MYAREYRLLLNVKKECRHEAKQLPLTNHAHMICGGRYKYFLICRADETFQAEDGAADILRVAKDHLLQGLADDNRDLK